MTLFHGNAFQVPVAWPLVLIFFAFHQFWFLSVEGSFAQMGAYHLLQLGHKASQGPVASVQPVSKLGANRHGFLSSPSLSQEMHVFHEGCGRPIKLANCLGVHRPAWRWLGTNTVLPFPHRFTHLAALHSLSLCVASNRLQNHYSLESITEGTEVSMKVNRTLLTLLITV
jgi:hypothetical protein